MKLPRISTYCALAALPMVFAAPASALDIDTFDGTQIVADAAIAPLVFSNEEAGSMLGGERDMTVLGGTGLLGTVGLVDDGVLNFSNSPQSQGRLFVDYDGVGNSIFGLGGVDLTDGGADDAFAFTLLFADFEVEYTVEVIDMDGDLGSFTGTLPTGIFGGGDEVDIVTPFASLSNPAVDFSNVGSIFMRFEAQAPAADITIDNFRTVPEPSSVALLLAGGALIARRRRRA